MKYLYQNNEPVGEIWHDASAQTNWGTILIIGCTALACIAVGYLAIKTGGLNAEMRLR